jgi:hypothetical protein
VLHSLPAGSRRGSLYFTLWLIMYTSCFFLFQEEMGENLEATKESWAMKLDSARNHIILLNLRMTLASLCFMISTVSGGRQDT